MKARGVKRPRAVFERPTFPGERGAGKNFNGIVSAERRAVYWLFVSATLIEVCDENVVKGVK